MKEFDEMEKYYEDLQIQRFTIRNVKAFRNEKKKKGYYDQL